MALKGRDFFTIVEFGTSKICALHGGSDKGGTPTVFGSGCRDSNGCIVKGEIVDLQAAIGALSGALEDADSSAGNTFDRERVYYLVEKRRTNAKNAYKAPKEISFAQSAPRHEDKGAQAQSSKRRTLSPSPQSRSK